jgi:hypothetical protein
MSVVAYKDGVMAGDSRGWAGRYKASPGRKRKIHRLKDGSLLGVSSSQVGMADKFAAWMKAGGDPDAWKGGRPDTLSALLVRPNGDLFVAEDGIDWTGPMKGTRMYAIGSGSDFALGAMVAGKTAKEAVKIACGLCAYCAVPVHTLRRKQNALHR